MATRAAKIKELLESFQALRRGMLKRKLGSHPNTAITPSQWIVLMEIEARGSSNVKEVAEALSITSSATTQLIDSLVKEGHVLRKPSREDRRAVSLTLSSKTQRNIAKMKAASKQKFQKIFAVLNEKEFDTYCLLTKKIIGAIDKNK